MVSALKEAVAILTVALSTGGQTLVVWGIDIRDTQLITPQSLEDVVIVMESRHLLVVVELLDADDQAHFIHSLMPALVDTEASRALVPKVDTVTMEARLVAANRIYRISGSAGRTTQCCRQSPILGYRKCRPRHIILAD